MTDLPPARILVRRADRLAPRLPPALRARSVAPQGDAMSGALLMVQHCLLNEMPA